MITRTDESSVRDVTYNVWATFNDWHRAAVNHAEAIKGSRMIPAWLPLMFVLFNFAMIGLCFRFTRNLSIIGSAVAAVILYLGALGAVILTLVWACRYYEVSKEALGIRPSHMVSDFRWALKICALGASLIGATLVAGFVAAYYLRIRLPAPPASYVAVLGGNWTVLDFITIAGLGGVIAIILAPITEELIYRSLFLPAFTFRLGLYPAIAITAIVFGLAHVIPFGQVGIPLPEVIGGFLMAAGFAIRWSVIPAMVIHAMGNLFASTLVFVYVQLFKASPALFAGQ